MDERATDDELDAVSRRLLDEIADLQRLERRARLAARSTPEFHALSDTIAEKARGVFELASEQATIGRQDSPLPAERREQRPGDWAEGHHSTDGV